MGQVRQLADQGMGLSLVALRVVVLGQISMVARAGVAAADRPHLYVAAIFVVFVSSAVLVTCLMLARRRGCAPYVAATEALVSMGLLFLVPSSLAPTAIVGTWENWAPAFALNSAVAVCILLPWRMGAVVSGLIAVFYLISGAADPSASSGSLLANALTYLGLGFASIGFSTWLRRVAAAADDAKAQAVEATRSLERERYRVSVHDATTILRQLADPAVPDPVIRALRKQALDESHRLRALLEEGRTLTLEAHTLGDVLDRALLGFEDLPLVRNSDLGDCATLPEPLIEPLTLAVRTLLHNVRTHAKARQVYVHATADEDSWEVEVRDDGQGFDPTTPLGFGLSHQVINQLERRGARVLIDTSPNEGTSVTVGGTR